jgi:hypothetical protein
MTQQSQLAVLGTIYTIVGAVNLILAIGLFAAMGAQDMLFEDARAVMDRLTSDVRLVLAGVGLVSGPLALIGGIGLLKEKRWAWGLVWVLACMSLLSFPIGTGLGAYALWVLTRSEVRESLGVDAAGSVMRAIKVTAGLSLLLILASYPACQFSEPIVQAELSKLSDEERALRQFDMVYMRWALPGVVAFLWGSMLAVVAFVSWIVERRRSRKRATTAATTALVEPRNQHNVF